MKKLIAILVLMCAFEASFAQRGAYGTYTPYSTAIGTIYNNSFTIKTADTLKGVDTVYVYFSFASPYRLLFDLKTVQKADSLSGTAILQARSNTSGWLTLTDQWQSITGLTSLCTTCSGSSKTYTLATGTNHALFDVGLTEFTAFRLRIVGTRSTDTTAVTATAIYGY